MRMPGGKAARICEPSSLNLKSSLRIPCISGRELWPAIYGPTEAIRVTQTRCWRFRIRTQCSYPDLPAHLRLECANPVFRGTVRRFAVVDGDHLHDRRRRGFEVGRFAARLLLELHS